jgi:DNA-binding CsgD family transcriptional regulator
MSNKYSSRRDETRSGFRHGVAAADVFSKKAWEAIAVSLELSGRELEIVRSVFEDRTEYAIATDLHISPHTVHTHVERLHHKLRVANRVQLVLRILDKFHDLTVSPQMKLPPICANWQNGVCPFYRATQ